MHLLVGGRQKKSIAYEFGISPAASRSIVRASWKKNPGAQPLRARSAGNCQRYRLRLRLTACALPSPREGSGVLNCCSGSIPGRPPLSSVNPTQQGRIRCNFRFRSPSGIWLLRKQSRRAYASGPRSSNGTAIGSCHAASSLNAGTRATIRAICSGSGSILKFRAARSPSAAIPRHTMRMRMST